ncbi:MAG: GtrA family protein [bacterium]
MKIPLNKKTLYVFLRFAIVGVINTALDLMVLNLLVYFFAVTNALIFSICKGVSFAFALVNSYFMNKYFTFAKKETTAKNFYIFVLLSLIGLFVNMFVSSVTFYLLSQYSFNISVNLIATISGIVGAMFSMVINYISYSLFVFK